MSMDDDDDDDDSCSSYSYSYSYSSCSSLNFDHRWFYDVFISFRGEDIGKSFVSHLVNALRKARITTYIDGGQLHTGTELGPGLLAAIETSSISIIVFSKNYTESSWCLDVLQNVMECHISDGQLVVPVFHDVDPSVVRHQKGAFGQVLRDTAKRTSRKGEIEDVVSSWKNALAEAVSIPGWNAISFRNEDELVELIVEDVLRKLNKRLLSITKFPVGLESRVQQVIQFIQNQSSKVCLTGIWGMGGSGKTTTAKAIFNQINLKFMHASFIENIREVCIKNDRGIIHLQQQLLSDVMKTNEKVYNIAEGQMMINERFRGKNVFVVLDDVTTFEQLKALCANPEFFGPGSVLIITTRDVHLLDLFKVDYVCKMKEMDENESLELFSWHVFRQPNPREDFSEFSKRVVSYCGGLPLALEVIGSYSNQMTDEDWISVFSNPKTIPNHQIQEKLRISYDGLNQDMEKDIFLDICCFFIGKDRTYVTEILNGCGLDADTGITVLVERSLLKVDNYNKLEMHDLIRDMGREIVRESSAKEPGKRSRLWFHEDVHDILTTNSGTETVEGLVLKSQRTGRVCFSTNSFKKMNQLRLLQLDCVDLTGDYGNLSKELRWVHWQGFTFNCIPDDFHQGNLVVFELKHSNIKQVWNKTKLLVNLKILNLSHSRYLTSSPDFSKLPNLEKLIMKDCPSLSEVHPSIGDLNKLLMLNLKDCIGLSNLPKSIYQLKSLNTLILSGCSKIDKLEEDIVQMESLTTLIANNTAVKEVPFSIVRSKSIRYISLCGYEGLSHDVFQSLIRSWMSPTLNSLPCIFPFRNITYYCLASHDVHQNNLVFLSPIDSILLQLRIIGVQFRSEIQLTQELRGILDDQYDISVTKVETSHASQISNPSLRSLLIGMGNFHIFIEALSKSISQGLTTNDSGEFFLPGDNYPSWLAYTGEGPSVRFQVPKDSDHCIKGITLCVVYSSTISENMVTECLASVLIINYTKFTVHIYKRDTIMSFNDEDWKNITSNLGPGDNVEIFVAFGHELIVKETAAYLIYNHSVTKEIESSTNAHEKYDLKYDVDAKFKGGPRRYQWEMDKASKRDVKSLNQSKIADEKGDLVNGVNRRMAEQIPYAVAESLFNRLASAAFREHGRIFGVMDELERLKKSVECIRVVLLDAQEKQEQNWIGRLKDVLHLADDLLDEFIIEGMRYKVDAGDKKKITWVFRSLSSTHFYLR
ncbi:putative TIR domain, P-loop containing nucleoside triphosphate hydrolase [Medicago truncatula]|uniref:Putative TIR domain, P-loop containing nucleoside triphosphate hydrolase n=1 Tax=Medicago truncatula TaxID=3880 RepID=A0A396GJY5_MEDTR|nr:disease resistance protein RUN1 [Medicago truncatula]RHN38975.1 putative TIR domain, P-loop containing nucleoside triphosphate hydrolase [Medicago truncatula]